MKIGLRFEAERDDHVRGDVRWLSNPDSRHSQYFSGIDMTLSPEVERALELTKPLWSRTSEVPVGYIDEGNHGWERGLVFRHGFCDGLFDETLRSFVTRELTARVSVGPTYSEGNPRGDFSNPRRVHVSVQGSRQFFPKKWKDMPYDYDDFGRGKDNRAITSVVEQVNVSMRWVDGKFDDWNNMDAWYKEMGSNALGAHEFNPVRTTYCVAYPEKISQSNSTADESRENVMKLVRKFGRKDQVIPLGPSVYGFDRRNYDHVNKALQRVFHSGVHGHIPIMGYDNVGSRADLGLSGFYDSSISKMSALERVEYLFGPVLTAVEKFTAR